MTLPDSEPLASETPAKLVLKTPGEFFTNPKPSTVIEEMKERMQKNADGILNGSAQQVEEDDWRLLGHKIVGAEGL